MNLPSPTDYISVFKTTTRTRWDLLTPIALAKAALPGQPLGPSPMVQDEFERLRGQEF